MKNPNRGRVYRRCACRDADGRQFGARCPKLANRKHGSWTYAVDLPTLDGKRRTRRRSSFTTKTDAQVALSKVLEYERTGIVIEDRQTVADYLLGWLRGKASTLKPTTMANYHAYVHKDLIPHIGLIRLEDLSHQHVVLYVRNQLEAGRGHTTLRRCLATLSSALGDAVRQHRLPYNAAKYVSVTRPTKYEPVCWSPAEAAKFLKYCADHNEPLTNLFELISGTGMRKGRGARPALGRRPPRRARALRPPDVVQRQQLHASLHDSQDQEQPRLGRALRQGGRRASESSRAPTQPRAGVHPTRRTTTTSGVRPAPTPQAHRAGRTAQNPRPRPASLRRDHHAQLASSTGHGVQDAAPFDLVDDNGDLRPPAPARCTRRSEGDRDGVERS
ncbi:AP2-like DNA-binding integrase family protein [Lentzea flaviverrucosa]|uniref:AP2-like DNA-binding integrase domain-containing protein n=1 Tax=Lentzea flaviverrucosa TaxID=200379 RepID=A0A1H9WTC6_9PSEU|nr:AP2-like DNA-binding integrase family protein [Lentzea flaviverrucosa]SES37051.1 AP2-like DNA-binding integrase domain-containing protein [Lentzea flaviverrucosa]